jgi:hypothetical protein
VAAGALALPALASASSISYIGPDGNVWLASPDGAIRHQVTHNATADLKYRSPSQINDGRVVALRKAGSDAFAYFLRRTDGEVLASWLMPSSGSGLHFAPYTGAQASPEGGLITYDYFHAEGPFGGYYSQVRVGFLTGPGQTDPCLVNCEGGYARPRWLPGLDVAGMIDVPNFSTVWIQQGASPRAWFGFTGPDTKVLSFDTRAGKTVAIAENSTGSFFVMMRNDGGYNAPPTVLCSVGLYNQAVPRLSPDGSMVAWEGPQGGVYVSPAPGGAGPSSACNLQPRLVGPGGTQPDWGVQDAPDLVAPTASLQGPAQSVGSARRRGVRLTGRCSEPCTVQVKGYVNGATARRLGLGRRRTLVARGTKSGGPGRFSFRAQLTRKAKAKLAGADGTVIVSFQGTARDRSGNARRVSTRARLIG